MIERIVEMSKELGISYRAAYQRDWFKRNPWLKTWKIINNRVKRDKGYTHRDITITKDQLKEIWFRDNAHELKRPSIDRIDNNKGYSYENCRYIELSENIARNMRGKKRPRWVFDKLSKGQKERRMRERLNLTNWKNCDDCGESKLRESEYYNNSNGTILPICIDCYKKKYRETQTQLKQEIGGGEI